MRNIILMSKTSHQCRVALLENGEISEFFVGHSEERGSVGNIYKGRVLRVLPGMQAAFVDIGQERAAFLYVNDIYNQHEAYMQEVDADAVDDGEVPQSKGRRRATGLIENRLEEGQDVLVQIAKEAIGTKGTRVTSHISLPGRFLVMMPTFDHLGISRRILDERARLRLRDLIMARRQTGVGYIVRTASEMANEEQIIDDFEYLSNLWQVILNEFEAADGPCLLYEELDLPLRAARDLINTGVQKVIVDDLALHGHLCQFCQRFLPNYAQLIEYYDKKMPLFDAYGLEIELARALSRRVWLPSGGYLVIDMTEALTAIDINTGKYVGQRSLEDTILQINLEAVKEIAYQLRLRNIGGIIVIDFIDMERISNRHAVFNALQKAFERDKARTHILPISEFGVVEMTRKRTRENITQKLCGPCFYCSGRGYVQDKSTVAYAILRALQRHVAHCDHALFEVHAHPQVAHFLFDEEREALLSIEDHFDVTIQVRGMVGYHIEHFDIIELSEEPMG